MNNHNGIIVFDDKNRIIEDQEIIELLLDDFKEKKLKWYSSPIYEDVCLNSPYCKIIQLLEENRKKTRDERPTEEALMFYNVDRIGGFSAVMYIPHLDNYNEMLSRLTPDDILCDMGAGDLRFALMASDICRKVYAVELSPIILADALKIIGYKIPRNLIPVCADWRFFQTPEEVTVVSCLVNIEEDVLPVKEWKENNRRVYLGIFRAPKPHIKEL